MPFSNVAIKLELVGYYNTEYRVQSASMFSRHRISVRSASNKNCRAVTRKSRSRRSVNQLDSTSRSMKVGRRAGPSGLGESSTTTFLALNLGEGNSRFQTPINSSLSRLPPPIVVARLSIRETLASGEISVSANAMVITGSSNTIPITVRMRFNTKNSIQCAATGIENL